VAENLGYYIDGSTSGTLQASFDAIESEHVKYVLRILAIKPMRRAKYFCTGSFEDTAKFVHYALNVPMYTHFTSPIRRYADVIVHRQLESILQEKGNPFHTITFLKAVLNFLLFPPPFF
jgi:protein SSD1